jgi:hypothetical protein
VSDLTFVLPGGDAALVSRWGKDGNLASMTVWPLRRSCWPATSFAAAAWAYALALSACGDGATVEQPEDAQAPGAESGAADTGVGEGDASTDGARPTTDAASGWVDGGLLEASVQSDAQHPTGGVCGQPGGTLRLPGDLAALTGCTSVLGSVAIADTDLRGLEGLDRLVSVAGSLTIARNADLTSLDGLSRLESVGGDLELSANPRLVSAALPSLQTVTGTFRVVQNDALEVLRAGMLADVLHIEGNRSLATFTDIASNAQRSIAILNNTALSEADAYLYLSSFRIDLQVTIMGNRPPSQTQMRECGVAGEALKVSYAELAGCTHLRGSLHLRDSFLPHLRGLGNLRSIGQDLVVFRPHGSVDLRGLENLETVGRELRITNGAKLESLDGASKLRAVGALRIDSNHPLRSVEGLSSLESVAGNLSISGNTMLPQAAAQSFADGMMVGGETQVGMNGGT